jgi:hypothetical protein
MKKIYLLTILIFILYALNFCKKDSSGHNLNTIEITTGEFNGYSHTFSPNLGFWSLLPDDITKYTHLVLGEENNQSTGGENVMSILFYNNGNPQVTFPSAEGQSIVFGINFNGIVYDFQADNAVLSVTQMDDFHFDGTLTGQFMDVADNTRKISFTMYLSLPLQGI